MTNVRTYWGIAILAFALAQPLACAPASKTANVSPTSTPTNEPTKDISGAILTVNDMPPEFESLSATDRVKYRMTEEDIGRGFPLGFQGRARNVFAFISTNPQKFALVYGGLAYPLSPRDIASIDADFANTNDILKALAASAGRNANATVKSSGVLRDINKYGDRSTGVYLVLELQNGVTMRSEHALVRRGTAFAVISVVYEDATQAPPSISELTRIFDDRIVAALGK